LVESLAGLAFGERIYDVDIVIEKRWEVSNFVMLIINK
jgi:hypothetical protein